MKLKRISVITSCIFFLLIVVIILNAKDELNSSKISIQGTTVTIEVPYLLSDINLKKGSGKYKYKSENSADAQQSWKIIGETPTSFTSFDQINNFNMKIGEEGEAASINDSFYTDTGIQGRKKNRYKQKFFYTPSDKSADPNNSSGHHLPSFGLFKAWLKDGNLKFMYFIPKAREGSMLNNISTYNDLRDKMSVSNKVKSAVGVHTTLIAGAETHGAMANFKFTAKKKAMRGKLE